MFNVYQYNQNVYQGVTNPRAATGIITAMHRVQSGLPFPRMVVGGKGGTGGVTYSVFKQASSYTLNLWRSQRFVINGPFAITAITIPLTIDLNQNHVIQPYLDFDNGARQVYSTEINNSNFESGSNSITLTAADFDYDTFGENNFCLQLNFTGSALIGVMLPIIIELETQELG